jgi:hypothetical protein
MTPKEMSRKIDQIQTTYVSKWSANAAAYVDGGEYAWLAAQIGGYARVLEIGVGAGHSTATLVTHGHSVLGIDLNPQCLTETYDRLRSSGTPVIIHRRRVERQIDSEGHYREEYGDINALSTSTPRVMLFQSDVLEDQHLDAFLTDQPPFDALVLWCVGTYALRSGSTSQDARHFRLAVQQRCFRLANLVVRQNGLMHVCDRIAPSGDYTEVIDRIRSDTTFTEGTALVFEDAKVREPRVSMPSDGINLIANESSSSAGDGPALLSLIYRRK